MPISLAVFGGDAFSQASMIRGISRRPYVPSMLDQVIGFTPVPVTTDTVYITSRKRYLNLIRTADHLRRQVAELLKPHDLSPAQYNVLRILREIGRASCRERV